MEHQIEVIAANTAAHAVEAFLRSLPLEVLESLSPSFLQHLEEDFQAELTALLQSRLLWSYQFIRLELENPQQHKTTSVFPVPTANPLVSPNFNLEASSSSLLDLPRTRQTQQPAAAEETPRQTLRRRRQSAALA